MAPLATPNELELYAGLGLLSEPRGDLLLDMASSLVRDYCGWHIAPSVTESVTVDGSGGRVQVLPTLKLTAVTSVTEDGDAVDTADLEWTEAGYLWRATLWTDTLRGIVANITHGYAEVPSVVVSVVCSVAARAAVSPTGVVREQTGPFSITYSQTAPNQSGGVVLLAHEARALDRKYRLPGHA